MKTSITDEGKTLYFDGKLYYRIDHVENCAFIHGAKKSLRKVIIPDTIEIDGITYVIKGVAGNAFTGHKMQSIKIGDEVRSLDNRAFYGCLNLEKVVIGKGLQKIGVNTFAACNHLTTINFPCTLQWIGHFAFCCCDRLNDIHSDIIDPSLCTVERTSFDEDTYQRVLFHVPQNTIDLYQQSDWKKFVHIDDGTPYQRHNHFSHSDDKFLYDTCGAKYSLDGTTLISVPKGIVFYDIIEGTTIIGKEAFKECCVETVNLPHSITRIEACAFIKCEALQCITLPDSINEISYSAFQNCIKLKQIVLPRYIDGIHLHTFCNCISLEKVYIPSSVQYIGMGAFCDCKSLTSVVIPRMASIEAFAFQGCTALKEISLPEFINEDQIEDEIFEGCTSLTRIYYPNNIIPERMFALCKNLECIEIAGKLSYVDDSSFYFCRNLRKVFFRCSADERMESYPNFWRFSGSQNIEFVIPQGTEENFKRLYDQAANNPCIKISVMESVP